MKAPTPMKSTASTSEGFHYSTHCSPVVIPRCRASSVPCWASTRPNDLCGRSPTKIMS